MPEPAAPEIQPTIPIIEVSGREKFVANMLKTSDQFGDWVEKTIGKGVKGDKFTEGVESLGNVRKSRDYLMKNAAIVGLYDIGMTIAAFKMGMPKEMVFLLWESAFLAPFLEEIGFRTNFVPAISREAAKIVDIDLTEHQGRMISSGLFAALHSHIFPTLLLKSAHGVKNFLGGEFFTKVAQEKGIWGSMYYHSLMNAAIWGTVFISELAKKTLPKEQAAMANVACWTTLLAGVTGLSLIGLKEVMEDQKIQKDLGRLRQADRLDKSLGIPQMTDFAKQLMNQVNIKGYKFRSGVEMAYFLGFLEAQEYIQPGEFREAQARKFVTKLIEEIGPDNEPKVKQALAYIQEKLSSPSREASGAGASGAEALATIVATD